LISINKKFLLHYNIFSVCFLKRLRAKWVEECTCPAGYTGASCEKCAPGFTRETPYGGPSTKCVPCTCNSHSTSCDPESGKCDCIHQTTGQNCELCIDGYYGDALVGTPNDCKKCPCPNDGKCDEFENPNTGTNDVVCLECPKENTGNLCEFCADGFYDPASTNQSVSIVF
jgi:laminin gamma 1